MRRPRPPCGWRDLAPWVWHNSAMGGLGMVLGAALVLGVTAGVEAGEQPQRFRFLATGDVPYFAGAYRAYEDLLRIATERSAAFVAHVGDIKRGSAPCSDAAYASVRDLFQRQAVPVVYTPGDNEWTDCHTEAAGSYDPRERLEHLRKVFFQDPAALRLAALGARHQAPPFVENYRFSYGGVLFITVHVVGSHNNHQPKRPDTVKEFRGRDAANRRFLKESFGVAAAQSARAVVVLFHADPRFERSKPHPGFQGTLETLGDLVRRSRVPVLLIHGDGHQKRIDHPLKDKDGDPIDRFTRLEVPGAPEVRGVMVDFDPEAPGAFSFEDLSASGGFSLW